MPFVPAVSACTPGGVTTTCTLPFKYKGVRYSKCTRKDASKLWCATKIDSNGNYITNKWAYCRKCPGGGGGNLTFTFLCHCYCVELIFKRPLLQYKILGLKSVTPTTH